MDKKEYAKKIIQECITQILSEGRSLVDNFDKVAKLLEFQSPDSFYFVQIIKRYKDNPKDDKTKGNYSNGAWYLKSWRIKSAQDLMKLKPEIIQMADTNNARAYITVNSRSEQETNQQIIKVKQEYPSYHRRHKYANDIVPAQPKHEGANWKGKRLRFFVDIDSTDQSIWTEVKRLAKLCQMDILDEYVTPSGGLHLIFPNREHINAEYFIHMLEKFDDWEHKGLLATAHANLDGKILLYSNVETRGY
jgi:hypothetical protein